MVIDETLVPPREKRRPARGAGTSETVAPAAPTVVAPATGWPRLLKLAKCFSTGLDGNTPGVETTMSPMAKFFFSVAEKLTVAKVASKGMERSLTNARSGA